MTAEYPSAPASIAILFLGRVHPLMDGRVLFLKRPLGIHKNTSALSERSNQVRFFRRANAICVRAENSAQLCVRGEYRSEFSLGIGDVVFVDRIPALIVETGFSQRYPRAIRWQGFVANASATFDTMLNIASASSSHAPLCLWGESGTGKEVAARAVHECSARSKGPWVAVNCAALPASLAEAELFGVTRGAFTGADKCRPGAFQRAHGGTLFLDEIAELAPVVQAKLLRVLQSGELKPVGGSKVDMVDVRVVTATWRDLEALTHSGDFRFDLLHRLWVLRVKMPPLRDRLGDLGPLLEAFLKALDADDMHPSRSLLTRLEAAVWEGNIRQLSNHVHRAVVWGQCEKLLPETNLDSSSKLARRGQIPDHFGIDKVKCSLTHTGGNRSAAARRLGISRSTLYRWLEREPTLQVSTISAHKHHGTA